MNEDYIELDRLKEEAKQFSSILLNYLDKNEKYVDQNFHPSKSIRENNVIFDDSIKWIRLDEINNAPLFKQDLIHPAFVKQGEIGNCFLVNCLSRFAMQPYIIPNFFEVDLPNQILGCVEDSVNIECGAVLIYFNCMGQKIPVLIDTLMPTKFGSLYCSYPLDDTKSAWFCLVEKAFAKLMGSYSNSEGGDISSGISSFFDCYYPHHESLSNYPTTTLEERKLLFNKIMDYQKKGAIMDAAITINENNNNVTEEELKAKCLLNDHTYLIMKAIVIEDGTMLICLRNPWGKYVWNGDWSNDSPLWTNELKKILKWEGCKDGIFWMNEKDFLYYFTNINMAIPIPPEWCTRHLYFNFHPGEHDGKQINFNKPLDKEIIKVDFQIDKPINNDEEFKFYVLIEKRHKFYDEKNDKNCKSIWYTILFKHDNNFRIYSTNHNYYCVSDKVIGNKIIQILFNRKEKCDIIEDCYALVFCKYKFKLYNADILGEAFPEANLKGYLLGNYSFSSPIINNKNVIDNCYYQNDDKKLLYEKLELQMNSIQNEKKIALISDTEKLNDIIANFEIKANQEIRKYVNENQELRNNLEEFKNQAKQLNKLQEENEKMKEQLIIMQNENSKIINEKDQMQHQIQRENEKFKNNFEELTNITKQYNILKRENDKIKIKLVRSENLINDLKNERDNLKNQIRSFENNLKETMQSLNQYKRNDGEKDRMIKNKDEEINLLKKENDQMKELLKNTTKVNFGEQLKDENVDSPEIISSEKQNKHFDSSRCSSRSSIDQNIIPKSLIQMNQHNQFDKKVTIPKAAKLYNPRTNPKK